MLLFVQDWVSYKQSWAYRPCGGQISLLALNLRLFLNTKKGSATLSSSSFNLKSDNLKLRTFLYKCADL